MKSIIIAIDGYSSCGKSTTARLVAQRLQYLFIDSGAMYRAVTWYFLEKGIDSQNVTEIEAHLPSLNIEFRQLPDETMPAVFLNNQLIESEIRSPRIAAVVSEYSAIPCIRKAMVKQQQIMGEFGGVVMDGRDIGTVVFPQAELKLFLTADIDIRVKRRTLELEHKGFNQSPEEIKRNLLHRDYVDTHRSEGPLLKASDAIEIDTTFHTVESQVELVISIFEKIISYPAKINS